MNKHVRKSHEISDEEEREIQEGIAQDPENPEWTEEDFRNARPFAEVFPELAAKIRADQEAQRAGLSGTKQLVWIPLDIEVVEALRATGEDWKDRVNEALRKAMALS